MEKKICIAGKNTIAIEVTKYIIEEFRDIDLFVIPNSTDKGIDTWQDSFLKYSLNNNLQIIDLDKIYGIDNLVFISLEFDKIIDPNKFKNARLYNIHFSLLPKYKGMYTSAIPILNNEKETGVTFHEIDSGIDTGDIIAQEKIEILEDDTAKDLYLKYIDNGIKLVKKILMSVIENNYKTQKQDIESSTYYSKEYIDYKNLKINLKQRAKNIKNQIRAFNFREYQLPRVYGFKISGAKIMQQKSIKKPGTIIYENNYEILIATIDYNILLYKDMEEELFRACEIGDINEVMNICQNSQALKIRNIRGWTPLIVATYNSQVEIVRLLISLGANIYDTNYSGTNLLMYAKDSYLKTNNDELLRLYLNLGISIYQKDKKGKNLLDYCDENLKIKIIELMNN